MAKYVDSRDSTVGLDEMLQTRWWNEFLSKVIYNNTNRLNSLAECVAFEETAVGFDEKMRMELL